MKNKIILMIVSLIWGVGYTGVAMANLVTIGTATYLGSDYKLIWDDDNNGNSVVWLDYSHQEDTWANQNSWAALLSGDLTINLYPGYSVAWDDPTWRLPASKDTPYTPYDPSVFGYEGDPDNDGIYNYVIGFNLLNSEFGHLYYEELGNMGQTNTDGSINPWPPAPQYFLQNTGGFENLIPDPLGLSEYWSATLDPEFSDYNAFYFYMYSGGLNFDAIDQYNYGLAIRSGQISIVPEPATMFLLGAGLVGVAGAGRRKKKNQA